jgi:hypothetical protein
MPTLYTIQPLKLPPVYKKHIKLLLASFLGDD